jgi:hypothetical protein
MKNKQHLIALDLDGTLLMENQEINPKTKKVILQAIQDGHIVVIATGRPHRASIRYYRELGLNTPMVNFNGAFTHHPLDSSFKVLHDPLPVRTAHKIVEASYELKVDNIIAEVMDDVYLAEYDKRIVNMFKQTIPNPYQIGNLKHKLQQDPTTLLIQPKRDQVEQLTSHLDDFHAEIVEHRKWSVPSYSIIEVIKKGMNKAVGLQQIADYFAIPKERIIAFGDENNDLEMIDYAGVGVAMGNAIDELKSIAKYVTDTNEDNGIGSFLENYLKMNVKPV